MELRFILVILLLTLFRPISAAYTPPLFPREALPTKSGYLPVNPATGSSIFYAFYEAQKPIFPLPQTPLLIWLQGGPGCSSMIGNFYELGPWRVTSHPTQLHPNPGAWNRFFGLLFLDNPVGVGFSIAASKEDIPRNQRDVAEHLYAAILVFVFHQNPGFKDRPIYITGESYAGKYVPAIGYYILKVKRDGRLNLKGLAIGNGLTDPVTQVATHAVNAYYSGVVNWKQKEELGKAQDKAIELIKKKQWREATNARNDVLRLLQNMTGLATLFHFGRKSPYKDDLVEELLNQREAKQAMGVNETMRFENCKDDVEEALHEDVTKSVKFMMEYLVENTRVLLYQGQLDLRDGVVATEEWVRTMKWAEMGRFLTAERKVWKDKEGKLAGYVQQWKNLSHAVVMGAGHLVPTDQAVNSRDMIEDWVMQKGLFGRET